jgi:adenylosuccinate lyase
MARNLADSGGKVRGGVLAEPAYILLAEAGEVDAHEVIRKITLEAEEKGTTFYEALAARPDAYKKITGQLEKLGIPDAGSFFANPERYRGLASVKARALAQKYRSVI